MSIFTKDLKIDDLKAKGLDFSRITDNKKVRAFEIWSNRQAGIYIYTQDNKVYELTFTIWFEYNSENRINVAIKERYKKGKESFIVCKESDFFGIQNALDTFLNLIEV